MKNHADKTPKNKNQSPANEVTQRQGSEEATAQFVDNRPETVAQMELQEMAKNSPRVAQMKAFQSMANNSPQVKQAAQFQTMANNHARQPIQMNENAASSQSGNNTGLPDKLKSGVENLSGMSMDDVKVHRNSNKPAQLQAHAYAQGTDIHLGPGQEKHLPHEAWHVVQQKQGRVKPTKQMKGGVNVNDDAGLEKEADVMGLRIARQSGDSSETQQLKQATGGVAQRVLIVGSYNEKYDIEDMGLWWAMACEHRNSAMEGFEAVILTLKDFERDYDQEFTISATDEIRFISHGNPGGTSISNETPKGQGEGDWGKYEMDLKDDNWVDIENKILTQIEVFNLEERKKMETGSLLKPYFCFMKANPNIMEKYHHGELDEVGNGPVFLTNHYILALDTAKIKTNREILGGAIKGDSELIQLFNEGAGWNDFDEVKAKLPLLNQYKTEKEGSTVDQAAMYDEIFEFVVPKYKKLVGLVDKFVTGNISRKAPWKNLRKDISSRIGKKVEI